MTRSEWLEINLKLLDSALSSYEKAKHKMDIADIEYYFNRVMQEYCNLQRGIK
jgi:hypothetical protein